MPSRSRSRGRQGPTASATIFPVGVVRLGNDGMLWRIISTRAGIHRWQRITGNSRRRKPTRKPTRRPTRKPTRKSTRARKQSRKPARRFSLVSRSNYRRSRPSPPEHARLWAGLVLTGNDGNRWRSTRTRNGGYYRWVRA
jgi:hypothetical protein